MKFPANHPRGPHGGPMFLGEELCPVCECCSLGTELCEACGGDGEFEPDDDDEWSDWEKCDYCRGKGSYLVCIGGCGLVSKQKHPDRVQAEAARSSQ